jgi:5-methylthioadenosine/S-adenosylhomocysteine deaminase
VAEDRFEQLFQAGVTDEVEPPALVKQTGRELPVRAAPAEAVALHGCVLTPERAIEDGYVVVGAGKEIQAVEDKRPEGVRVHETEGVILPGLLDLHGHLEFNVFAPWEPPRQFVNRYAWRGSEIYDALVRDPQNKLLAALPPKTQLRYAEIRALVGGVTAIQGTGGPATSYQDEALVRNVDKWVLGAQVGRSLVDLPSGSRGLSDLKSILDGIEAGKVEAFYIHLAEGHSDNERSRKELDQLMELNAPTEKTVVIHGTALGREPLGRLKDAGARLVWSPPEQPAPLR